MKNVEAWAAVARDGSGSLSVESVGLREVGPYEVLIQNKAAGMCHTDLSVSEGKLGLSLPIVPGHEAAGVVVACGDKVSLVSEGDHVIIALMPECGECRSCRSGRSSACTSMFSLSQEPIFRQNGEPLAAMSYGASFATHTIAPETALVVIPDDVPWEVAALIGCGVSTGVGAVRNTAHVEPGSTVVVFGLGSIGLNVVQGARLAGASRIIALDGQRHRRDLGLKFGATEVLDPAEFGGGLVEHLTASTGGGADFVFECVGNPRVLADALQIANMFWGVCVAVGAIPYDTSITVPGGSFLLGRSLLGTFIGNVKPRSEMPTLIEEYRAGQLNLDDLVTARFPLSDINKGFELMKKGAGIRTVIVHD